MTETADRPAFFTRPAFAVLAGLVIGIVLLAIAQLGRTPNLDEGIAIGINGLPPRMARDVLLPAHGWTIQVSLPGELGDLIPEGLTVEMREERTGLTLEIQDRMTLADGFVSYTVPKSLGLYEGLLAIRANLVDAGGRRAEDWMRVRLRPWPSGPPIGSRQVIHFDFEVDRDGNGRADFVEDLERLGLVSTNTPEIAELVANHIAERALARVRRAYNPDDDPNRIGRPNDIVTVLFQDEAGTGSYVTRICVGGEDPTQSHSVGHVRFDHRNARKSSVECDVDPAAGLFPSELATYRDSALYQQTLGAFLVTSGGTPIGAAAGDRTALQAAAAADTGGGANGDGSANPGAAKGREARIRRAIEILGDALGSIMAHETGHALGLVAEGRPGVGLFGGESGDDYVHNLDSEGNAPSEAWLMNSGRSFSFETLAGLGENGPLRFRPLNHAYLRDRVVLIDGRAK